jgi:hypothetical protein
MLVIKLYNCASRACCLLLILIAYPLFFMIGIVNYKFKDYNSALEDLSKCVKREKKNSSAHTYLVSKIFYVETFSYYEFMTKIGFHKSRIPSTHQQIKLISVCTELVLPFAHHCAFTNVVSSVTIFIVGSCCRLFLIFIVWLFFHFIVLLCDRTLFTISLIQAH